MAGMNNRRHQKGANHERWLISYADLLTLLFALFVVLYASAKVDSQRLSQMSEAIKSAFQQLSASGTISSAPTAASVKEPKLESLPKEPSLDDLSKMLNTVLAEEIARNDIQIRKTPDGIVLSLKEIGFFPSGEATLLPQAHRSLARIARVTIQRGLSIRVEGHTDSLPIHTVAYPSNWELSAARATAVIEVLIGEGGFDAAQLSIAGFAGYRPVASNDTEEGRALNRRVDLVIREK
jgi:chemotaxis protein MotB